MDRRQHGCILIWLFFSVAFGCWVGYNIENIVNDFIRSLHNLAS